MKTTNVMAADASYGYLAAERGEKSGNQGGGNKGGNRGGGKEREGMSREEAGRKGGEKVSQDREHMSEIGRKGGEKSRGGGRDKDSGNR